MSCELKTPAFKISSRTPWSCEDGFYVFLSLTRTLFLFFPPPLCRVSLSFSLSLSSSLPFFFFLSLSLSLSHTHTHAHAHAMSRCACVCVRTQVTARKQKLSINDMRRHPACLRTFSARVWRVRRIRDAGWGVRGAGCGNLRPDPRPRTVSFLPHAPNLHRSSLQHRLCRRNEPTPCPARKH